MNIPNKKSSRKKIIIGALLVLVIIAAGTAAYVYAFQPKEDASSESSSSKPKVNKVNNDPPTDEQIKAGQDIKQESVENSTAPAPSNPSTPLVVSITSANQNGETVSVRSLVDTVASQAGTCSLVATNGAKSITKTAATQAYPNGSTCQGFDIPVSELGMGNWNIKLTVTIGMQTGSATQSLDIK